MTVLVFAAHPDDETIGAGGTIARLADAGHRVHLCIATETWPPRWEDGEKERRRAEALQAAEILGVSEVEFGGFKTMTLSTLPEIDLASAAGDLVRRLQPDIILAPPRDDINGDHGALFRAVTVASRALPGSPVRAVYAYEIATTTRFCASPFAADTYVDVSETFARKLEAMKAYKSELREFPHPRSVEGLEILARERGLGCGATYAECFMLVRRIVARGGAPTL